MVITGEGKLDEQTLQGKGPAEVARRARAAGLPVIAVAGALALDPAALTEAGIEHAFDLTSRAGCVEEAICRAQDLLVEVGQDLAAQLLDKIGRASCRERGGGGGGGRRARAAD